MNSSRRVQCVSLLVFGAGLINIVSSVWAEAVNRITFLEQFVPMRVSNVSRTITADIGLVLLFLSVGLWQRKKRAWILSLLIMVPVLLTHMIKGLDIEEAIVNLAVVIILLKYRQYFTVKSQPISVPVLIKSLGIGILGLTLYGGIGFAILKSEFRQQPLTIPMVLQEYQYLTTGAGHERLIPVTRRARWFYDSIVFTHTFALILIFPAIFAPFVNKKIASKKDWDKAVSLIARTGANSVSPMAGLTDKVYFFNEDETCVIAYRVCGKFAVVLGDPIGYEEERKDMITLFTDYCFSCGLKPVWYNVDHDMLPLYEGYRSLTIGEEAVIALTSFSLQGSALKDVRNAVTKIAKMGVTFAWIDCADVPWKVLKDIDSMHAKWLKTKKMSPMTFSLENYPLPTDQQAVMLLASYQGSIVTALSFFPYRRARAYVVDLMLREESAPNGIMEAAVAEAARYFKERDVAELNLSLAPLVISQDHDAKAERRNEFVSRFSHWYKFGPLRSFKNKFAPEWRPKYVVYQQSTDLPGIALAVLRVHRGQDHI